MKKRRLKPYSSHPKHQQGAAIIIALFVVALVAMTAAIMMERLRTDIRRTELVLNANEAYLYAQGSILWAIDQLNKDWITQQPNKVIDRTPITSPINKVNGYTITSTIYDAQGSFNINNLSDQAYQTHFARLIHTVSPDISETQAKAITQAIVEWITPAKSPTLDEYYLKLTPSYRAPHRPMVSISELRLVKDISPALFTKLLPYITALPKATLVSINNASAPVIMSLSQNMSFDSALAIEKICKQAPFNTVQDFLNFSVVKNNPIEAGKITLSSNYFLVVTNVTLGEQQLTLYTLLERIAQDKQTNTVILWQSKGSL